MAFTRNIRITRHGIRMHDMDLTLVDDKNRSIEVGPASGLLARDAGGTIIHDIPDAPVQVSNYYMGHVLWFNNDDTNIMIVNTTSWVNNTWYQATCVTNENSNIRGGVFQIFVNGVDGSGSRYASSSIELRPYGSNWTASTERLPKLTSYHGFDSGTICYNMTIRGMLLCPIGDDNKIEWRAYTQQISTSHTVKIAQVGVLI